MRLFPTATLACALLLGLSVGCASTRSGTAVQASDVIGTWQYETRGSQALSQGTIRIRRKGDRLQATVRDRRRGQFRTRRVQLRGHWMELRLDQVLVTGQLRDGRYRASVEIIIWDVTTSSAQARRSGFSRRGSLEAYRVRAGGVQDGGPSTYGCEPLLRETSYACSPLRP